MKYILAALAATMLLGGCGTASAGTDTNSGMTRIETAYSDCTTELASLRASINNGTVEVADEGRSLIADGVMDEGIEGLACVMLGLGVSDSLISRIDSTTAMMGRQHAEEDGLTYDWSFHPDSGIDMTVTEN